MKTVSQYYWLILIAIFATVYTASAQFETGEQRKKIISETPQGYKDTALVALYIKGANYFLDKPFAHGADLDSANTCIERALAVLTKSNNKKQIIVIHCLQARSFFKSKDFESGRKIYMDIIHDYQVKGMKKEEAEAWYGFGISMMYTDPFAPKIGSRTIPVKADYKPTFISNMNMALALSSETGDIRMEEKTLAMLTAYHITNAGYQAAQKYLARLITLQNTLPYFKPYEIEYLRVLIAFWVKKDMVSATSLTLNALRNAINLHCEPDALPLYIILARTYRITGQIENANAASREYIAACKKYHQLIDPSILHYYLNPLLKEDKHAALDFVKAFDYNNPAFSGNNRFTVVKSYIEVYTALNRDDLAAPYFPIAEQIAEKYNLAQQVEFSFEFGKLYFLWGKYDKARPIFEKALNAFNVKTSLANRKDLNFFLFKIDSAMGNSASALAHFKASMSLKDTLESEQNQRNIAELNIKYQTEKKENDIQLLNSKIKVQHLDSVNKAKNILLLNNKVKLQQFEEITKEKSIQLLNSKVKLEQYKTADKEKSILVLTSKARLQAEEVQKAEWIRNLTFIGAGMLLIILSLLYNQYRINRRNNETVRKNNEELQVLLQDKEVLMREIHHRVKNNLQMVLSLLESQSAYLENDALLAIQSSYNRVLAMSLIHQKLYITDSTTDIDMSGYLWELITYLQESFSTGSRIFFQMDIEHITLDVVQAVPLGLIVNEAVTNAIKYAFPQNAKGIIRVLMSEDEHHRVTLGIHDNGIGLPENFDIVQGSSLGLRLIKGLSNNLEAELAFETTEGTGIHIIFTNMHASQLTKAEC